MGVSCRAIGDVVVDLGGEGAGFECSVQNENDIGIWSRVSGGISVWFCNMGWKSWCHCWECFLEEMSVGGRKGPPPRVPIMHLTFLLVRGSPVPLDQYRPSLFGPARSAFHSPKPSSTQLSLLWHMLAVSQPHAIRGLPLEWGFERPVGSTFAAARAVATA